VEPQDVDDRGEPVDRSDQDRAVLDIGVRLGLAGGRDPDRSVVVALRERGDAGWDRRREKQRLARRRRRRGLEDPLELVAEPHVEHLVGLVEHGRAQPLERQRAAAEVVTQPARRPDHEVWAARQRLVFALDVHPADAGRDRPARLRVQPGQLARDLHRQLAGRRDDERERPLRGALLARDLREPLGIAEQGRRDREPERDGLARAGLRRHHQIRRRVADLEDRALDRRRLGEAAIDQREEQGRVRTEERHGPPFIQGGFDHRNEAA
jgi:hypothetical protein